jgi:hypothetical protein
MYSLPQGRGIELGQEKKIVTKKKRRVVSLSMKTNSVISQKVKLRIKFQSFTGRAF